MSYKVPAGSRPAARVILINEHKYVLYLHAREDTTGKEFWVMPGGGLEANETFEEAAIREVREETGLTIEPGPCVWKRRHIFDWLGRKHDQFELYFISYISGVDAIDGIPDDYVHGYKWWSVSELENSSEEFAPRRVAKLLPVLLDGKYPSEPYDCGI